MKWTHLLLLALVLLGAFLDTVDGRRRRRRNKRRARVNVAAPEVAQTCNLTPKTAAECQAKSHALCGVTNSFSACRAAVVKYCVKPEAANDVQSCVAQRCAGCTHQPGLPGVGGICSSQICQNTAQTCDLTAKPEAECKAKSHALCGVTNSFSACRAAVVKYCVKPEAANDVQSCVAQRCAGCTHQPGLEGFRGICVTQCCPTTTTKATTVAPTGPPKKSLCKIKSKGNCDAECVKLCGKGHRYAKCRAVVKQYCENPVGHRDVVQCVQDRCQDGCRNAVGKGGVRAQCRRQLCKRKAEKPCVIKCRVSSLQACGVTDRHKNCRRRYMIGCIEEVCHNKRRNVRKISQAERNARERAAARKKWVKEEMPCKIMCKMQSYKKCGVTSTHDACRTIYFKDCQHMQCKEAPCESDCRLLAFNACGTGPELAACREDYRELCRPVRCRRANCERESLLQCGELLCRSQYIDSCLKNNNKAWRRHILEVQAVGRDELQKRLQAEMDAETKKEKEKNKFN